MCLQVASRIKTRQIITLVQWKLQITTSALAQPQFVLFLWIAALAAVLLRGWALSGV